MKVLIALLGGMMALGACAPRSVNATPVAAWNSFNAAMRANRPKDAYQLLSSNTKAAMKAIASELGQAAGGTVGDDPALLMLNPGTFPTEEGTVRPLSETGPNAEVEITTPTRTLSQKMVREGAGWYVDASDMFSKGRAKP